MNEIDISVVMTVYADESFLEEAILSVLKQTYENFEFIIVIEYGADKTTVDLVQKYSKLDKRICLVWNEKRLGLAESLNEGIRRAKGKYIARMDDDDISLPCRFLRQRELLENEPDIGICGGLQVTLKCDTENILQCASDSETLKAEMLFGCQLSHTSVMFRRALFIQNKWFYDGNKLAEDYDLWIRILDKVRMANVNEVLVKHRYGYGNISEQKGKALYDENVKTIQCALEHYLGIDSKAWHQELFCPWRNFPDSLPEKKLWELLKENIAFTSYLEQINQKLCFIKPDVFAQVLTRRFLWIFSNIAKRLYIRELSVILNGIKVNDARPFSEKLKEMLYSIYPGGISNDDCVGAWNNFLTLGLAKRIIIYGLGQAYREFTKRHGKVWREMGMEIVALTDSDDANMQSERKRIYPSQICDMGYDLVLISSGQYYFDIKKRLMEEFQVPEGRIALLDQVICAARMIQC